MTECFPTVETPFPSLNSATRLSIILADSVTQVQWAQKYSEAQAAGTRATKLELAGSYDQAFQTYVKAAQAYLFLIRHAPDGDTKAKLRTVSAKLVERAEKIKQAKKANLGPVEKDRFSLEEQDSVLAKSSTLDGQRLSRWTQSADTLNRLGELFRRPAFSAEQQARGYAWKRARDVWPGAKVAREDTNGRTIQQNNVSDCSLVAALIVAAEHHAKFGSKLGISCLHPHNESGWPTASETGCYSARLRINGAWRKITIDDYLPVSSTNELMCASTSTRDELWPALIEKAYLSLSGSYDFHGSNSANDLYTLSGWLPEHISLRSRFRSEQTWTRLSNAFQLGKCVLTLGTGKVLDKHLERAGLTTSHNYAVLDLRERDGRRELEIINPWSRSGATWSTDLRDALPGGVDGTDRQTLFVTWEDISIHFSAIHVNWDPSVFDFSDTAHLSIPSIGNDPPTSSKRHSVSLRIRVEPSPAPSSDLWVFVARHSVSSNDSREYLGVQTSRSLDDQSSASTLPSVDDASTMTDDPYSLQRIVNSGGTALFDLVVSHEGPSSEFAFSVSVFSNDKVRVEDGPPSLPYSTTLQGAWSGSTAGGNHTSSTFLYNPQYRVTLSPSPSRPTATGDLELYAQTSKESPINAKLLVSGGKRVGDFENRDVLAGGASYSYGRQSFRARDVKPGSYTLVVSSFQPSHEDTFHLALQSSLPLQVSTISAEGAGMYSRTVRGRWSEDCDGGSQDRKRNPTFKLELLKATNLRLRLQTPELPAPIAVSVYSDLEVPSPRPVISSEPYSDFVCGVTTTLTTLQPSESGYLVIPSTFTPHTHTSFVLHAYGDAPFALVET